MSHTKGPWEIVSGTKYKGNYEITAAIDGEHEANARLIAAAPELLAALKNLLTEIEAHDIHAPARIAFAKKAIAKAGGES